VFDSEHTRDEKNRGHENEIPENSSWIQTDQQKKIQANKRRTMNTEQTGAKI
jgi:hypothetical protein